MGEHRARVEGEEWGIDGIQTLCECMNIKQHISFQKRVSSKRDYVVFT